MNRTKKEQGVRTDYSSHMMRRLVTDDNYRGVYHWMGRFNEDDMYD